MFYQAEGSLQTREKGHQKSYKELKEVSKGKCQVLHLERKKPMSQYRLGTEQLEKSLAERIWMVHEAARVPLQQRSAKSLLDCVRSCAASRLREVILPIY